MRAKLLVGAMTFVACATYRPSGDSEIEALTGVRTMNSTDCVAPADCIKAAFAAAKKDCDQSGKGFELVTHGARNTYLNGRLGSVTYRCTPGSQISSGTPDWIAESPVAIAPIDGGLGRCALAEVNEMRAAHLSESAIERACAITP